MSYDWSVQWYVGGERQQQAVSVGPEFKEAANATEQLVSVPDLVRGGTTTDSLWCCWNQCSWEILNWCKLSVRCMQLL